MYILTMAKLDAVSHCLVAILANHNLPLSYRAGKTKVDVDALLRVSWPICVSNILDTHYQVTTVVVQAMQEAALEGSTSPTEAPSCNLCILDLVGEGPQVA